MKSIFEKIFFLSWISNQSKCTLPIQGQKKFIPLPINIFPITNQKLLIQSVFTLPCLSSGPLSLNTHLNHLYLLPYWISCIDSHSSAIFRFQKPKYPHNFDFHTSWKTFDGGSLRQTPSRKYLVLSEPFRTILLFFIETPLNVPRGTFNALKSKLCQYEGP